MNEDRAPGRVHGPAAVEELMATLTLPGVAALELGEGSDKPLPVVVERAVPGESVVVDITATGHHAPAIMRQRELRLVGRHADGLLRTPPLPLLRVEVEGGRQRCYCEYPAYIEQHQRRDSYRAALRLGMHAGVLLRLPDTSGAIQGDLRDLSMGGCQVRLPGSAAEGLEGTAELELCFVNGTRFVVNARARRHSVEAGGAVVEVGFEFLPLGNEQDRQLWYLVREIEREAARSASDEDSALQPSPLFAVAREGEAEVGLGNGYNYATPMARRLARVADYLSGQLLELREGAPVDPALLSRAADRVLVLQDEDREALLLSLPLLPVQRPVIQQALALAVRLVDIGAALRMPRELLKALAACALIHDLGRFLGEPGTAQGGRVEGGSQRRAEGLDQLRPRLRRCQWLSDAVREAVLEGAYERLDGSGEPHGWRGDELHELTRLTSVAVEIEQLAWPAAGREALDIVAIRQHLLQREAAFDPRWVQRYFSHFGQLPVGAPVALEDGRCGWVAALDEQRRPGAVQLCAREQAWPSAPLDTQSLGERLQGAGLAAAGPLRAVARSRSP
ncbi:PilZ domain-containing protein [Parahaliea aestuarii]|uniref:Phosphohydrolase n=1 Tax=Parahaliea aestuarii TaxID=1852021 RepID=A0A5C9A472_9GAMM|nr:PilZ domain-containing protein [Parahaliea aestuarii]TXS94794.1 phosphohydrolase [Parahaliea aestuarii]